MYDKGSGITLLRVQACREVKQDISVITPKEEEENYLNVHSRIKSFLTHSCLKVPPEIAARI